MNLLKSPGSAIYSVATFSAFLSGLLVSLILLVGFGYAGIVGDAPGDSAFSRYSIVAAVGVSGTIVLFIGLLGTPSHRRTFPDLTVIGTASLLFVLAPYSIAAVRGGPQIWTLLLIFVELAALILSFLKLKQLRSSR
jgi:hypothetical protein